MVGLVLSLALIAMSGVVFGQGSGHSPRLPAAVGTPTPATFEHVERCLREAGPQLFCAAPSLEELSRRLRVNTPHCNSASVLMGNNAALLQAVATRLAQVTLCGNAPPSPFIPAAAPSAPAAPVAQPTASPVDSVAEQRRLERQRRALQDRQRTIQERCAGESLSELATACRVCLTRSGYTWIGVSSERRAGFDRALQASGIPEARFRCVAVTMLPFHNILGQILAGQQHVPAVQSGDAPGTGELALLQAVALVARHVQVAETRRNVELARTELVHCQQARGSCEGQQTTYNDARQVLESLLEQGSNGPDFDEVALLLTRASMVCAVNGETGPCQEVRDQLRRALQGGRSTASATRELEE
jgi:hypothetical protein